jgi:hypothetical protein
MCDVNLFVGLIWFGVLRKRNKVNTIVSVRDP